MLRTDLWKVSEIRYTRSRSRISRPEKSKMSRPLSRDRSTGVRRNINYKGFIDWEFLQEILPEHFAKLR